MSIKKSKKNVDKKYFNFNWLIRKDPDQIRQNPEKGISASLRNDEN